MIGVLFLCWIAARNALSQTVTWTVGTAVPRFTDDLKLTCAVSADCCNTSFRIWEDAAGMPIMNDGVSSDSTKYKEDWDGGTAGFSLIIKDLQRSDVGVDYNCRYKLLNDKHTLTQDALWEYQPTEECKNSYSHFAGGPDFTYDCAISAPSPSVYASIGGQNVTAGLTLTGPTNFDTWFYSFKVFVDADALCGKVAKGVEKGVGEEDFNFKLFVTTGTSQKAVCEGIHLCFPCWKCAGQCLGLSIAGKLLGYILTWLFFLVGFFCCNTCWKTSKYFCIPSDDKTSENSSKLYGKSYKNVRRNRAFTIAAVATIIGSITVYCVIIAMLLIGINCPSCKDSTEIAVMAFGGGAFIYVFTFWVALKVFNEDRDESNLKQGLISAGFVLLSVFIFPIPFMIIIYHLYLKDDKNGKRCLKQCMLFSGIVSLSLLILPIPVMIIVYFSCLKGGNNRSKESGSSCWPPCSVGPDPNSPDPENARSLLKKNADKKNEKKPVAVVRSQPPKNRHVKTDNTESTRYSAETEIFDEGVHKSAKSRPLPSIGQPTISPRPLPQMPPSSQLEKGGIQLEPLGDSTSEKKKKKRRKKKESKQSGDED